MPIGRVVELDELVQMLALERIGLEREVLIGAQVVNPQLSGPRYFAGGLALDRVFFGAEPKEPRQSWLCTPASSAARKSWPGVRRMGKVFIISPR